MDYNKDAPSLWTHLDALRQDLLTRAEELSALTIPKLFPVLNTKQNDGSRNQDYQSFGAQCVNHLSTKLMLTLFAPSRPFVRLEPSPEVEAEAAQAGVSPEDLQAILSKGELRAVKQLDALALRPKLFELLKHLIVVGNVLAILNAKKQTVRILTMRNYVVKRDIDGIVQCLVIKENILFDELAEAVQKVLTDKANPKRGSYGPDTKVDFYTVVKKAGKKYETQQWVNEHQLPEQFSGSYPEDQLPYRALTWDLADSDDYGTGLAEDYMGDLNALSVLSEALVNAAILASEFRWLASPTGMTRPEDFTDSANGECLPGSEGDLTLVQAGREVAGAMQVQQSTIAEYINRLGRGFLMSTAVTRNAERVTAEEIRMQAQELETGLGGGYSRLAVDVQKPLAYFLLDTIGLKIKDKSFTPVIITGLDALSRNGDLENLKLFLQDVGAMGQFPPEALARMRLDAVIRDLGIGRGIDAKKYVKSDDEVSNDRAQQAGQEVATAGGVAQAEAAAQQPGAV